MSKLYDVVSSNEDQIRSEWMREMATSVRRGDLISEKELNDQSRELLTSIVQGLKSGDNDLANPAWTHAKERGSVLDRRCVFPLGQENAAALAVRRSVVWVELDGLGQILLGLGVILRFQPRQAPHPQGINMVGLQLKGLAGKRDARIEVLFAQSLVGLQSQVRRGFHGAGLFRAAKETEGREQQVR